VSATKKRKPKAKAAASAVPYFQAVGQVLDGYGSKGQKFRPFDYDAAFRQFNHWAFAANMCNANAVANVPLRLYGRRRGGMKSNYGMAKASFRASRYLKGCYDTKPSIAVAQKVATFAGEFEEIVEPHPALQVLRQVNHEQNGYELTVLRMIDLQATGNSYIYVVGGGANVPSELWRMQPNWVEIVPSKTNLVDGYVYGLKPSEKRFKPEDVIHFRLPNPTSLLYGRGWYEAAWSAICLHDSKRTMDLAKFDNMARPDWLLSVKTPGVPKEVVDKFADDVNSKLRGSRNSGKFLSVNAEVSATALNQEVPEVGTTTRIIEEISAVSGVPVAMLLSNDPTKASSQTARVGWYRNTIRPYCRLDEEKLNEKYLPMFEGSEDLFLAYDMVSFEDEEAQAKRLVGLVAGGLLKPNEGRMEMGYDPLSDPQADTLYPPSGSTGAASATVGDMAVGQNQDRQNEN
jgi:HK97 family phage portal protein